jgi:hypothetical protein
VSAELVRYDAMCRAIDAAYAVDEVKAIHDKAAMLQAAARVAHNVEAETRAYEIRMRAFRKEGELSKKLGKTQGQRSDLGTSPNGGGKSKTEALKAAGISSQESSRAERLSEVPQDQFEAALATKSVRELIDKPPPVSGDALDLIGTLRQFERVYFDRTPQEFLETMTPLMLAEVYRLVPRALLWLSTLRTAYYGRPDFSDLGNNPSPAGEYGAGDPTVHGGSGSIAQTGP